MLHGVNAWLEHYYCYYNYHYRNPPLTSPLVKSVIITPPPLSSSTHPPPLYLTQTTPPTLAHWWFSTWGAQPPHPNDRPPPLTHQPINLYLPNPYPELIVIMIPAYHPLSAWWGIVVLTFLASPFPNSLPFFPGLFEPHTLFLCLFNIFPTIRPIPHVSPAAPFIPPHPLLFPPPSVPTVASFNPSLPFLSICSRNSTTAPFCLSLQPPLSPSHSATFNSSLILVLI